MSRERSLITSDLGRDAPQENSTHAAEWLRIYTVRNGLDDRAELPTFDGSYDAVVFVAGQAGWEIPSRYLARALIVGEG